MKFTIFFATLLLLTVYLGGCSIRHPLVHLIENDLTIMEEMGRSFLANETISYLFHTPECSIINTWKKCGEVDWEGFDIEKGEQIYASDIAQVLDIEDIDTQDYDSLLTLLKQKNIDSIRKVIEESYPSIEIESGLDGLRFSPVTGYTFSSDNEYYNVQKVNDHRYAYTRDRN